MEYLDGVVVGFIIGWGICLICLLMEGVYHEVDYEDTRKETETDY
jgi:hypothetical protein